MPSFKVKPCSVADAAALARNNMSAYWTDSTWRLNFPGRELEDIITQCTKRIPRLLLAEREQKRHEKLVDADSGAVLGYARWIVPDRLRGEWLSAQTPAASAAEEADYAALASRANWVVPNDSSALGQPLEEIMNRLMLKQEYIELEYLGVHPDYRGQGVATALVQHGITVAEEIGADIIVMAYKAAVGVYRRLGFEMVETLIQDDSKYGGEGEFGAYFMVRRCKA